MPKEKIPKLPQRSARRMSKKQPSKQPTNAIDITTSWMLVNQLANELMQKLKAMIYCHNPATDGWEVLFGPKDNSIVQLQKLTDVLVKITDRIDAINQQTASPESATKSDMALSQEDMEMLKDWLEAELAQLNNISEVAD